MRICANERIVATGMEKRTSRGFYSGNYIFTSSPYQARCSRRRLTTGLPISLQIIADRARSTIPYNKDKNEEERYRRINVMI